MLKVYLRLRAKKDLKSAGWKEGEICELENDVFDETSGIAFFNLDKDWEIVKMELKEYKPVVL